MEIIRATPGQAAALTALVQASSAYRGRYASILEGYEITPEYVAVGSTFTAAADGRVLGFYSLIDAPPELDLLFVADDAQGLGVGARLVRHMLAEAAARGWRAVRVVSHPPALPFYLRMGAERIGTLAPRPPKVTWERPELRFTVPPAGEPGPS